MALNLKKRGIEVNTCCQTCGYQVESILHTFLHCWWSKCLWEKLGLLNAWNKFSFLTIEDWIWFCITYFPPEVMGLISIGASMIWRNRNLIVHSGTALYIDQTSAFIRCRANHFFNPFFKFSLQEGSISTVWQKPKGRIIKINCDGSWLGESNRGRFGLCYEGFFSNSLGFFSFVL